MLHLARTWVGRLELVGFNTRAYYFLLAFLLFENDIY
jgi:hypothetical protein